MIPFLLIAGGAYLLYDSVSDKRASFDPLEEGFPTKGFRGYRKGKAHLADGGKIKITNEYREFDADVFNEIEDEVLNGFLVKDGEKEIGIIRVEEDILDKGVGYIFGLEVFEKKKGYGKKIIEKVFELYPTQKSFGGKATTTSKEFWSKLGAEFENDYDFVLNRNKNLARGGKVSRFEIIKDETGYVEQGFYGVFDKQGPELLDIFEFRKEAEGYVKELNEKGISGADASKYNGQIQNYVLAEGGKIKQK